MSDFNDSWQLLTSSLSEIRTKILKWAENSYLELWNPGASTWGEGGAACATWKVGGKVFLDYWGKFILIFSIAVCNNVHKVIAKMPLCEFIKQYEATQYTKLRLMRAAIHSWMHLFMHLVQWSCCPESPAVSVWLAARRFSTSPPSLYGWKG